MSETRLPVLFLGHGSPMNAIEENKYTETWRQIAKKLPRPEAIVLISAHWYTRHSAVTAMQNPRTIHDFGGFPQPLYDVQYPAPGSPDLAKKVAKLLSISVEMDQEWGLDHGAWCVLRKMYPNADIPTVQLSIDGTKPTLFHYEMGQKLSALRDQGVLIVGSGNVVHNLRTLKWKDDGVPYPWAQSFNQYVRDNLNWQGPAAQHPLVNFKQHEGAELSIGNPAAEHYLPLVYAIGCRQGDEPITVLTDGILMGSLSMLSVQIGTI